MRCGTYDFIVANYANPDMVGHTGVWPATVEAMATIDACLARVVDAVQAVEAADPMGPGAILAITADHGNADDLRDAAGAPVTARRPGRRRPDPPRARRAAAVGRHHRSIEARVGRLTAALW